MANLTSLPGVGFRATPRGTVSGALADALRAVKDYGNKLDLPYVGGAGDLVLGQAPEMMDDLSYGQSPIKGAGMAATVDPRMVDLATLTPAGKMVKPLTNALLAGIERPTFGRMAQRGMFAGHLSKTADQDMLKIAMDAADKGMPPERVYDATGWFKGADGQWKYEIPDNAAKMSPIVEDMPSFSHNDYFSAIGDDPNFYAMQHQELRKAYPRLGEMPIAKMEQPGLQGSFNPGNPGELGKITVDPNSSISTLGHEFQHAIQQHEGFARGGAPNWGLGRMADDYHPIWSQRAEIKELLDSGLSRDEIYKMYDTLPEQVNVHDLVSDFEKGGLFEDMTLPEVQKTAEHWKRMKDPETEYQRLGGEVEARNVQTRFNMTPDERRMRPPWTTEDVPAYQQTINLPATVKALRSIP